MRKLRADFVRPSQTSVISLWTLAAIAFSAAIWVGTKDLREWRALSAAREGTAELQAQFDAARASQAARAASAAEAPPFAADARRWMALSRVDSDGALRSIESARVMGAKVSGIDLDADSRRVDLEIEVTSADVAASYLQALNSGSDRPMWTLARLQAQGAIESATIRGQIQ